jgi:hypothetical protein
MNREPLPTGCHTIKSAAQYLGIPQNQLYKKLRGLGWLHTGSHKGDPRHNTPRRSALIAGLVTQQQRGYPAPYNKNVVEIYMAALLTQRGLTQLESTLQQEPKTQVAPAQMLQNQQQIKREQPADEEREKAISQLREWGFMSNTA